MKELLSDDGKYKAVQQDDGNFVIYDREMRPLWDRFSYDANLHTTHPVDNFPIMDTSIDLQIPTLIAKGTNPIGMSYWRNINQHKNDLHLYLLVSIQDELVIYTIRKSDLVILAYSPLNIHHTGEGCFFSAHDPTKLFIPFDDQLITVDILTGARCMLWNVYPDRFWQIHSNYTENTFSATIKDSNYNPIFWKVKTPIEIKRYPIIGEGDECQIDKSGDYLMIKEGNDNRIIQLRTGVKWIITNKDGALGHSDIGSAYAIGENDMSPSAGALDIIYFETHGHELIYSTGIWNMGYVSHTNWSPYTAPFCLLSTPKQLIKVNILTKEGIVICNNPGEETNVYEHRVKANLCPQGEFAAFSAYVDNNINTYLVRLPN